MVDITSLNSIPEASEWADGILQLENGWRPTGGLINLPNDEGILNAPLRDLANRTVWLRDRVEDLALQAGLTVTVGAGGDFPTINAALIDLSRRRPGYVKGGFQTQVRLLNGFVMQEQVFANGVNLGWITITSEAAEVFIDRAYLVDSIPNGGYPAFSAQNGGTLPVIGTLFTMMATGVGTDRNGMLIADGGFARVLSGCGIRNAGGSGVLVLAAASLAANGSIFTGAGQNGASILGGSRATMQESNLSGAAGIGLNVQKGSSVEAENANLSGCTTSGATGARGASLNIFGANCRRGGTDSSSDIVAQAGASISAGSSTGGTNIAVNTVTANGIIYK